MTGEQANPAARRSIGWPLWAWTVAACAVGLILQSQVYLNHDVAYILWGAGEMLGGARIGHEIFDVSPPAPWFFDVPISALAQAAGWPIVETFRATIILLILVSVALARGPARPSGAGGQREIEMATGCFVLFAAVLVYRDFGQREHIAAIMAFPYLVLIGRRLEGMAVPRWRAATIGGYAAIGLVMKPHFLIVPVLCELLLLFSTRRWRVSLRAENFAGAAVVAAYALLILLAAPAYLTRTLASVADAYWAYKSPFPAIAAVAALPLVALGLAVMFGRSGVVKALLAAASGFGICYFVQAKGFSYHLFPLSLFAAAGLAAFIGSAPPLRQARGAAAVLMLAMLLVANARVTSDWWAAHRFGEGGSRTTAALIALLDRQASGRPFLAISTHPSPAFPVGLYSKAEWGSSGAAHWLLPAIVKLRARPNPSSTTRLLDLEREARSIFARELDRVRPAIILVDEGERQLGIAGAAPSLLDFYREDRAFRRRWQLFRDVGKIGRYRIYRRSPTDRETAIGTKAALTATA